MARTAEHKLDEVFHATNPIHNEQQTNNQLVQRLLASKEIQAKLTINPPDDEYEKTADKLASEVTQELEPHITSQPSAKKEESLKKMNAALNSIDSKTFYELREKEQNEKLILTKPNSDYLGAIQDKTGQLDHVGNFKEVEESFRKKNGVHLGSRWNRGLKDQESTLNVEDLILKTLEKDGEPFPEAIRMPFEHLFAHDFSMVRLHKDREASLSSETIGALAYTLGQHIVFGEGQYQPDTSAGIKLISHELIHVLQNGGVNSVSTIATGDHLNWMGKHKATNNLAQIKTDLSFPVMRQDIKRDPPKMSSFIDPKSFWDLYVIKPLGMASDITIIKKDPDPITLLLLLRQGNDGVNEFIQRSLVFPAGGVEEAFTPKIPSTVWDVSNKLNSALFALYSTTPRSKTAINEQLMKARLVAERTVPTESSEEEPSKESPVIPISHSECEIPAGMEGPKTPKTTSSKASKPSSLSKVPIWYDRVVNNLWMAERLANDLEPDWFKIAEKCNEAFTGSIEFGKLFPEEKGKIANVITEINKAASAAAAKATGGSSILKEVQSVYVAAENVYQSLLNEKKGGVSI